MMGCIYENDRVRKILITGATGFVGSNLTKRLVDLNFDVHVIIRPTSSLEVLKDIHDKINIHVFDGNTDNMLNIFEVSKPDVVIHLAAYFVAEHKSQQLENLIQSNLLFGTQLLEGMINSQTSYLINTGTCWQHYKFEEYNPVDLYAATKKAFEDIAKYYVEAAPIRMITLKLLDTYGPNDCRPKLFTLFKRIAESGEVLEMSEGEQILGLVYISDVLDAYLHAMNEIIHKPEHYIEDFFVSPEETYTLKEVASIYEKVSYKKLNINWGAKKYRFREVMEPFMGKKLPGWRAKVSLSEGIGMMLNEK